jgi:hypothetical protein
MHPAIWRYVAFEKKVGFSGDWERAQRIALHVYRTCELYGWNRNPY